eukprot:5185600-Amphidinium_carterae.1
MRTASHWLLTCFVSCPSYCGLNLAHRQTDLWRPDSRARITLIRSRVQLLQQGHYQTLIDLVLQTTSEQAIGTESVAKEEEEAARGGLSLRQAKHMHRYATRGRVLIGMKMLHSAGVHSCTDEMVNMLGTLLAPHDSAPTCNPNDATPWEHLYTDAATLRAARTLRMQRAAAQLGYTAESLRIFMAHPALAKALVSFIAFSGEQERREGAAISLPRCQSHSTAQG